MEEIIKLIPGVHDVAVSGKHHPVAGSLITAFVVKKPGANLTENDIKNFMATRELTSKRSGYSQACPIQRVLS